MSDDVHNDVYNPLPSSENPSVGEQATRSGTPPSCGGDRTHERGTQHDYDSDPLVQWYLDFGYDHELAVGCAEQYRATEKLLASEALRQAAVKEPIPFPSERRKRKEIRGA